MNFFQELRRRNVYKAAISYVVISWAALQASDIIFPIIGLPERGLRYLLIALIVGFPMWIVFAYIFEWTPKGFRKTDDVAPQQSMNKQTDKKLNQVIIMGLSLAVVLLISDRIFGITYSGESTTEQTKSIAVLPFENMSVEEDAYFAAGVTEDILTHISKIGDLRVLSHFTLKEYDSKGKTVEEIGKELGVSFLLTGSIRRAGDDLRISCHLVQVNPEEEAWAENFDRRMEDVFAIQTEVAKEVAKYLQANLSLQEQELISAQPTKDLAAYNIYLKGREEYNRYQPEGMKKAIEYFKQALDRDPSFALAWAGLADAFGQGAFNFGILPYEYIDSARVSAEKAVGLNPQLAEAWKAMGLVSTLKGEYEEAMKHYRKSLDYNPNYTPAISNLANLYAFENDMPKAIALQKNLIASSPLNFRAIGQLGMFYDKLEMQEEALEAYKRSLEIDSANWSVLYNAAYSEFYSNNIEASKQYLERMVATDPDNPLINEVAADVAMNISTDMAKEYLQKVLDHPEYDVRNNYSVPLLLGYTLIEENKTDSAKYWIDLGLSFQLEEINAGNLNVDFFYMISAAYAMLGEKEQAIDWMEKAIDNGYIYVKSFERDPWFASIRQEARYQEVLEDLKLRIEQMRMEVTGGSLISAN